MKDQLKVFNKKYQTKFLKVRGSKDEVYSDGLVFLRFDDAISIKALLIQLPISCKNAGEDYDLLETGQIDNTDLYFMVYT